MNKTGISLRTTIWLLLTVVLLFSGCSIRKIAVNSVANALTEEGTSVFATDNDPQLVGEALPFALKTMEALLQSTPRHQKLLTGTAAGFVQYGHAFVLRPAEFMESSNLQESRLQKERARKLFLRARDYGLRAMEVRYNGFSMALRTNADSLLSKTDQKDLPALYWTGVAWISAISISTSDMGLVADLPLVTAVLERCLFLEESWQEGAIHEVFIPFDASRTEAEGGGLESAERHYLRAMELNGGRSVSPKVAFAESVCVKTQDRETFQEILQEVLDFDAETWPAYRLSNMLAQQKARFLLEHIEDYFI